MKRTKLVAGTLIISASIACADYDGASLPNGWSPETECGWAEYVANDCHTLVSDPCAFWFDRPGMSEHDKLEGYEICTFYMKEGKHNGN